MTRAGAQTGRRRGRRRLLRPLTLVVLTVAVWLVLVGLSVLWARNDATRGLQAVSEAQARVSPRDLVEGRAQGPLREAAGSFRSAHRLLGNPVVAPLRLFPVAGRQLRSATALTGAAAETADAGADAVEEARAALAQPHRNGPERVTLLRRLAEVASRADERLADLDLGPGHALVEPLATRRAELVEKLEGVRSGLRQGAAAAQGLANMLAGPSRYLVLAANNAEMRAGSGMFLSVGELTVVNGQLSLGDFRPAGDLLLPAHAAPPIEDADLAARWGWLVPNREWRNLGASPRFDASATLASRMWTAGGAAPVDGVLALDPVALRAVLKATGPVSSGGRSVSAGNVTSFLLHDQYAGITSLAGEAQAGRREQLGVIAKGTLLALEERDWDVAELASGLAEAARGRHLMAWSTRPVEQRGWAAVNVNGRLGPTSLGVAVLNQGGNKLDQFLDVDARLRFEPRGRSVGATLDLVLQNTTPPGQPPYIAGPHPASGVGAGDYVGLLSVTLPAGAEAVTVEGRDTFAALGPDGPAQVVAVPVTLRRGAALSLTYRFRMPSRQGTLRIEPSGRVPPVHWTTPDGEFDSGEARSVAWG